MHFTGDLVIFNIEKSSSYQNAPEFFTPSHHNLSAWIATNKTEYIVIIIKIDKPQKYMPACIFLNHVLLKKKYHNKNVHVTHGIQDSMTECLLLFSETCHSHDDLMHMHYDLPIATGLRTWNFIMSHNSWLACHKGSMGKQTHCNSVSHKHIWGLCCQ